MEMVGKDRLGPWAAFWNYVEYFELFDEGFEVARCGYLHEFRVTKPGLVNKIQFFESCPWILCEE